MTPEQRRIVEQRLEENDRTLNDDVDPAKLSFEASVNPSMRSRRERADPDEPLDYSVTINCHPDSPPVNPFTYAAYRSKADRMMWHTGPTRTVMDGVSTGVPVRGSHGLMDVQEGREPTERHQPVSEIRAELESAADAVLSAAGWTRTGPWNIMTDELEQQSGHQRRVRRVEDGMGAPVAPRN